MSAKLIVAGLPRSALGLVAGLCALASGCLDRGDPCGRDADCAGGRRCVDERCTGASKPGAPTVSCADGAEPNDSLDTAPLLASVGAGNLTICASDDDWFALDAAADDRLSAVARFALDAAEPTAALALYDPAGGLRAIARVRSGEARIDGYRALVAGRHYLRVYLRPGARAGLVLPYSIAATVTARPCDRRVDLEPPSGRVPMLDASANGRGAAGAAELWRVELQAGESIVVTLRSAAPLTSFELGLYWPGLTAARPLAAAVAPAADRVELRYGPVSALERPFLRVESKDGAGPFALAARKELASTRRVGTVRGVARYEDRAASRAGLGPPTPTPLRGARLEVVRAKDDYVLATVITDSSGAFATGYVDYGDGPLVARALALSDGTFVDWSVRRSEDCAEIYAIDAAVSPVGEAAPLSAPPPEPKTATVELFARATDAGGAFNVFANLGQAFELLRSLAYPSTPRPLRAYWERGISYDCGSCQLGDALYIGGGATDPDEYDDAVLLHETGHFFENVWSRTDNPGGAHDGSRTNPTLAWSEGFATFWSALVRSDPLYVDTRDGEVLLLDIERPASRNATGTEDGQLGGALSEHLVSALLWDLLDVYSPDEPWDVEAHPAADLLAPSSLYFTSPRFADRGAPGVDLVDWLDGWRCLGRGDDPGLRALTQNRIFPYDFPVLAACAAPKPTAPVRLELAIEHLGPDGRVGIDVVARALEGGDALRLSLRLRPGFELVEGGGEPALEADGRRRFDRIALSPRGGDELRARFVVRPPAKGDASLSVAAVLEGPGPRVAPVVRAWPEPHPAPLFGRRARSARGHPLIVLGGSP